MLRGSRSWQDTSEVSGWVLLKKQMLLTAGNTSSIVIDRLCDEAGEEGLEVAWLYIDYLSQEEQTVTNMMGAILKRLVCGREIPKEIKKAFHQGRKPLLAELIGRLESVMASLPPVFICIDALDECLPKYLPELLESLRDIVREYPTTRIFLTGRPHVSGVIQKYFTGAVVMPISPNMDDVRNYLEMKLDRDEEPEAMDGELRADIVKVILDKMSDMCVGALDLPFLLFYTNGKRWIDSSLFR